MTQKSERIVMLFLVVCLLRLSGVAGESRSPSPDGRLTEKGLSVDSATVESGKEGKVYCLDATTGAKLWEHVTGGAVISSPWPADAVIYVGSDDGKIYALENE